MKTKKSFFLPRIWALCTIVFVIQTAYSQTWTGTRLNINHPTWGVNTDPTAIFRADNQADWSKLRIQIGDEQFGDFSVGYTNFQNNQWVSSFDVNGSGNGYFAGSLGLGVTSPTEALDINGTARLRGLAQNNSLTRVAVSDINGKLFWRNATIVDIPSVYQTPASSLGIGPGSLSANSGTQNTAHGYYSLANNTIGWGNSAFGYNSLNSNATGERNTAVGYNSLKSNTGTGNSAFGAQALFNHTTGYGNSAFGYVALFNNTTGERNCAFGEASLISSTTGHGNTAVGNNALSHNTIGNYNTAIGHHAGIPFGSTISFSTAIGVDSRVNVDYGIVLGTVSNFVGIRNSSPAYALHVQNAYCDGNTWFNASDKNLKENFARVGAQESILAKVLELPIQYWNYKGGEGRHIGPTAQDFHRVFQLGTNEKAIASVDEAGVALAAIQELAQKTEKLEALVKTQQELIAALMKTTAEQASDKSENKGGLSLHQNSPNPFTNETEVRMFVPETVARATLYVYDLQGRAVQQISVTGRGQTSVKIEGNRLGAGLYLYALVGDAATTPVRRMVLTE